MADYKVYKAVLNEDSKKGGVLAISLVDDPAIESQYMEFEKLKDQPHFIALKEEDGTYKQELLGAVLRPDFYILRKDKETKEKFYLVYDAETIELTRNKFHKEKRTDSVNLMHDSDMKVDAFVIESYIIQTELQLEAVKDLGLTDIEVGAWIVRLKIESEEVFDLSLDDTLNGFSIEGFFGKELLEMSLAELQAIKNNNKQNSSNMSKLKKIKEDLDTKYDEIKVIYKEFQEESQKQEETPAETEVKLEDAETVDDEMLRFNPDEIGSPVLIVVTSEDEEESTTQAPEGEIELKDNRKVVVDADGNLVEVIPAPEAEEEVEAGKEKTEATVPKEEPKSIEGEEKTKLAEDEGGSTEKSDLDKTVREHVPTVDDGWYNLEVAVSNGEHTSFSIYKGLYKEMTLAELVEDYETLKADKVELSKEIKVLQEKIKEPVVKPTFSKDNTDTEEDEKSEFRSDGKKHTASYLENRDRILA